VLFASQKMEIKTPKLAIIAGNGNIPFYLLEECERQGKDYCLIIIEGHGQELANKYKVDFTVSLSKMGKAIKFVKDLEIRDILMVGGINRPSIKNIIPDLWTAKFLAKISTNISGDNSILSNLTKSLENEGFKILAPENIIPSLLCPTGILGNHKPNTENKKDILDGFKIAKTLGSNDIGQSLVIENGLVLAVEAAEGTDSMIIRAASLKKEEKGGVLIKIIKPQQDKRIDRPVIGINTLKAIKDAGFEGVAIESNEILIINFNEVISYANDEGLFIEGI